MINKPAQEELLKYYRIMVTIRNFEETVLENFVRGLFYGTTHTYLGQEANAVGVISQLRQDDIIFSNHRCHGHFLAYGGQPYPLFAELMGKASGVCGGRGGSQHLQWHNFYSNGVQGGIVPVATGMALAEKTKQSQVVTVVFLGDGTLGEGVIYESFNMAALWQAPILFVVENNQIAQTTPSQQALAGDILQRFQGFGIDGIALDTSDALEIVPTARKLLEQVRNTNQPKVLFITTCRFGPHSKGDDTRPPDEVAQFKQERDPIQILARRLPPSQCQEIEAEVNEWIRQAFETARLDPEADPTLLSAGMPRGLRI